MVLSKDWVGSPLSSMVEVGARSFVVGWRMRFFACSSNTGSWLKAAKSRWGGKKKVGAGKMVGAKA